MAIDRLEGKLPSLPTTNWPMINYNSIQVEVNNTLNNLLINKLQMLLNSYEEKETSVDKNNRDFLCKWIKYVLLEGYLSEEICKKLLIKFVCILRIYDESKGKKLINLLNQDKLKKLISYQKANLDFTTFLGLLVGICGLILLFTSTGCPLWVPFIMFPGTLTLTVLLPRLIVKHINKHLCSKKISNLLDTVFEEKEKNETNQSPPPEKKDIPPISISSTPSLPPHALDFCLFKNRTFFIEAMKKRYLPDPSINATNLHATI